MAIRTDHAGHPPRQTTKLVLLLVALAAIAGWWTYRYYTTRDRNIKPLTRRPSDYIATWRCLSCGHTLEDAVGIGPKTCPQCGQDQMYTHIRFACGEHGVFLIAFQYDQDLNPIEIKIGEAPWIPIVNEADEPNLVCPTCGGPMVPAEQLRTVREKPPGDGG